MKLTGLHHVTAIASDPARNVAFYTEFLGLRLVKQTVNFDDPGTYHLYYGDDSGTPGTILTFFPWPQARRGSARRLRAKRRRLPTPTDGQWAGLRAMRSLEVDVLLEGRDSPMGCFQKSETVAFIGEPGWHASVHHHVFLKSKSDQRPTTRLKKCPLGGAFFTCSIPTFCSSTV
jgi:catechol 2,3-dioxygenase-like lactoylglutathione lyase family enzyme